MEQPGDGGLLVSLHLGAVIGVAKAQNLDHILQRPFRKPTEIGADLRLQPQRT